MRTQYGLLLVLVLAVFCVTNSFQRTAGFTRIAHHYSSTSSRRENHIALLRFIPYASPSSQNNEQGGGSSNGGGGGSGGLFNGVTKFFEELDAFIDDATARRLGNGAAFYGKRKSSFYGKDDKMRKVDRLTSDPSEDYQGPSSSGFFKWVPDDDGVLRPVTRMKNQNLERKSATAFWDNDEDI